MELKKGYSAQVVEENVQTLLRAGKSPREALIAALMLKRDSKEMFAGGAPKASAEAPPEIVSEPRPGSIGSILTENARLAVEAAKLKRRFAQ